MQHVWRFVVSIIKESDLKVTSAISSKSLTIYFNYHRNAHLRVTLSCSDENGYRGPIEMNNHDFHKCKAYSRIENGNLQLTLYLNRRDEF